MLRLLIELSAMAHLPLTYEALAIVDLLNMQSEAQVSLQSVREQSSWIYESRSGS